LEKDYIMRVILEFFRVLAGIIMKRESKSFADAVFDLETLSRQVTSFGIGQLKDLGKEGIVYVFEKDKKTEVEKIYYTAILLREDGNILEAQGYAEDSLKSFSLSKELFELISASDSPEKNSALKEIEELNKKLSSNISIKENKLGPLHNTGFDK
jgi:hypothetical protein